MTCEKASNSTITLSLLGSPNVLVVFVEVGVTIVLSVLFR